MSETWLPVALIAAVVVACAALGESQRNAHRRAKTALGAAMSQKEELESEVVRRRVVEAALRQREADEVIGGDLRDERLGRRDRTLASAVCEQRLVNDVRHRRPRLVCYANRVSA